MKPKKAALSSEWSYTRGSERGETGGLSACRGLCYAAAANWSATVIDVWERSVLSIWRLMQCASDNFIVRRRIASSFSCKPIFCTAVALLKIATCLAWKIFPVQLFAWVLLTATPTVLHSLYGIMVIGYAYRKQTLLLIHLYCTLYYPWHLHSITQWRGSTWVTIHNRERQIPAPKLIRQWYIELHILFIVQKLIVPTRKIVVVHWIPCCITTCLTWDLTIAEKKVQVALTQGRTLFHAVTVCMYFQFMSSVISRCVATYGMHGSVQLY